MNKKLVLYVTLGIGILFGILILIGIYAPKKTNWNRSFSLNNKNPFDYYILYNELKHLTDAKSVREVKDLEELKKLNSTTDVIFYIDKDNSSSSYVFDEINKLDSLPINLFYSNIDYYNKKHIKKDSVSLELNQKYYKAKYNRYTEFYTFVNNTKTNNKTLGKLVINDSVFTNYYLEKSNKMNIYTHTDAVLFTNFYLLNKDGYSYAKEALKPFNGKNIYWINPDKTYIKTENSSVLSFILSQPELRAAWYILLASMFLYFIFKSKREQKIIPVIQPEKNLSLDFAHAIASMYYESGKPQDIIKKQIDYFYYKIRKQFNVITDDVHDDQFIYILSQKAQISKEEVIEIITELEQLYQNPKSVLKDVNRTYEIIENYKKKAHLL